MLNKLFFMCIFLLVIGGIGFLAGFTLNVLPQPVYEFVYTQFAIAPPSQSNRPYMQKFEGHWEGTFKPDTAWSDVERCPDSVGTLTISSGKMSGTLGSLNKNISVTAGVDDSGTIAGTFYSGGSNSGQISGTINNTSGNGRWKDVLGCEGGVTFSKLDPVVDPLLGKILSFNGEARLIRGGHSEIPSVGMSLYAGDVVQVPQGARVDLSVGVGVSAEPMTLTGPTTYAVTAPN